MGSWFRPGPRLASEIGCGRQWRAGSTFQGTLINPSLYAPGFWRLRTGPPCRPENVSDMSLPKFKRIMLKLSGEVLMGNQQFGIDPEFVAQLAGEVKAAKETGLEICLVIGGGNIFRGMAGAAAGMDRAQADYM